MFQGRPNCLLQWRLHSDVLGTSLERQFQKQYKAHYSCIIFNPTREMCCIKYLKVSRCLFLKFWRNIQRTSSKRHEMMSKGDVFGTYAGHQFWTSRTNAFKLHYFQFFFTRCVKHSYRFLEKRLKDVPKWRPVDNVFRPSQFGA